MIRLIRLVAALVLLVGLSAAPAHACTPIMSVANGAVAIAYLIWLVMTVLLMGEHVFAGREMKRWVVWVPVGLMVMAAPMLAGIFFPFSLPAILAPIAVIAFPMHLAVEFFAALFEGPHHHDRGLQLLYYGLPLFVIVGFGVTFKLLFYGSYGGVRALVWNYAHAAEVTALVVWVAIGLFVLMRHVAEQRGLPDP